MSRILILTSIICSIPVLPTWAVGVSPLETLLTHVKDRIKMLGLLSKPKNENENSSLRGLQDVTDIVCNSITDGSFGPTPSEGDECDCWRAVSNPYADVEFGCTFSEECYESGEPGTICVESWVTGEIKINWLGLNAAATIDTCTNYTAGYSSEHCVAMDAVISMDGSVGSSTCMATANEQACDKCATCGPDKVDVIIDCGTLVPRSASTGGNCIDIETYFGKAGYN